MKNEKNVQYTSPDMSVLNLGKEDIMTSSNLGEWDVIPQEIMEDVIAEEKAKAGK